VAGKNAKCSKCGARLQVPTIAAVLGRTETHPKPMSSPPLPKAQATESLPRLCQEPINPEPPHPTRKSNIVWIAIVFLTVTTAALLVVLYPILRIVKIVLLIVIYGFIRYGTGRKKELGAVPKRTSPKIKFDLIQWTLRLILFLIYASGIIIVLTLLIPFIAPSFFDWIRESNSVLARILDYVMAGAFYIWAVFLVCVMFKISMQIGKEVDEDKSKIWLILWLMNREK